MKTLGQKSTKSNGDYVVHNEARTFAEEFYYVNLIDSEGRFDSKYSKKFFKQYEARNFARELVKSTSRIMRIPYKVKKVGLYSSRRGHVESFNRWN